MTTTKQISSKGAHQLTNGHLNLQSQTNKQTKAQDELNIKILRDLSQLPANRHCFDCGQRGPTYVNVTIGSFVCMTCSGLLRGLTPPQRVKSISMATFTNEEIDMLKQKGNEHCDEIWLKTCPTKPSAVQSNKKQSEADRRANLKAHMSAVYEQKRYYQNNSSNSSTSLSQSPIATPPMTKTQIKENSPRLNSSNSPQLSLNSNPSPHLNNRLPHSLTLPSIKPLTTILPHHPPLNFINNLSPDTKIVNRDPWVNSTNAFSHLNGNQNQDGFANFDQAFFDGGGVTTTGESSEIIQPFVANFDDVSNSFNNNSTFKNNQPNTVNYSDRYAALKDLDDAFKAEDPEPVQKTGLPSSASLPAISSNNATGWLNPFSVVGGHQSQSPGTNGWTHNPFFNSQGTQPSSQQNQCWQPPPSSTFFNPFASTTSTTSNPKNPFL